MRNLYFYRMFLLGGAVLGALLFVPGVSGAQTFYNFGDANADGWCNWADTWAMVDYFRGFGCANLCPAGADANGSGQFDGLDVTFLVGFLRDGGPAPIGACPCPVVSCDPTATAQIEIRPVQDADPATATFTVSIMTSVPIAGFNFSLAYDPTVIADIATADALAAVHVDQARPFLAGDIRPITFEAWTNGGGGIAYPVMTDVFELVLTAAPGAPNALFNLSLDDPIYGPPRFYESDGVGSSGCQPIFPTCTFQPVGDVNGNGAANGIDVTFFVSYLKGGNPPVGRYFWNLPVIWAL